MNKNVLIGIGCYILVIIVVYFVIKWIEQKMAKNRIQKMMDDNQSIRDEKEEQRRLEELHDDGELFVTDNGFMTINPKPSFISLKKISLTEDDHTHEENNFKKSFYQRLTEEIYRRGDDFYKEYEISLRIALKQKLEVYENFLKQLPSHAQKSRQNINSINDLISLNSSESDREISLETKVKSFQSIIRVIHSRLENLNVEKIRENFHRALLDKKHGIESLVGREEIKDMIAMQILAFKANPKVFVGSMQNIVIFGGSGFGKTKLAIVLSHAYCLLGILVRNKHEIVTKHELTSSYVSRSGKLMRKKLETNLEGVLFIDEAYDLGHDPNTSAFDHGHGEESITEMVHFLDMYKGLSIVIAVGYKELMERRFLAANEGMDRRFPHKIELLPYNSDELTEILLNDLNEKDIKISKKNFIFTIIEYLNNRGVFDRQAGDILNLSSEIVKYFAISNSQINRTEKEEDEDKIMAAVNHFLKNKGKKSIKLTFNDRNPPT